MQARPQFYRKVVGSAVLAVLLVGLGYYWYDIFSKVSKLSVTGTAPGPMKLVDDAQPEPLHVHFGGAAARLDLVGKPVTEGIRLAPALPGEWRWVSDTQLSFIPKEDWAVGQDYRVELDAGLFADHVRLARYDYRFRSARFSASVSQFEFHQDPKDPRIKKVVTTVVFSHPVDSADFEKRITLRMAGQSEGIFGIGAEHYPFTVSYNKFKGEAYIHSDSIAIPAKDSHMTLTIDAGVRAARGGPAYAEKLKRQTAIPGMFNFFRIKSAGLSIVRNERYEPERVLIVETTAGVLESGIQKNLSVYLLPKDRPAIQDRPAQADYHWNNPIEIGPEVLSASTPVILEPLPTDREYPQLHSFKYRSDAGRYLYIKLNKGIEAYGGYVLAKEYDSVVRVPAFPRELNIMYDGAVLSLSGEKKISLLARDIEAIRYEISRILPSQINHLVSQSDGHFRSPHFNSYAFNQDNISELFTEIRVLDRNAQGKTQYAAVDLSSYISPDPASGVRRGLFFFRAESWDPVRKAATGIRDSRLILVTNLGLVVKDNVDGSHDVFVQSINDGLPVAGVQVQVLGKNGLAIVTASTDARGHLRFPKLDAFQREKAPTVYLARRGEDLSFMPYKRDDRRLNFSRFDIGGEVTGVAADRLSAYLFSDRGIYRPGDAFRIGAIIKAADWKQQLTGIPLETVITDARGLEVQKRKIVLAASGFEELSYQTEETSPTGNYQASVYIVKDGRRSTLLGSTGVRVEEFLPDRLKIGTRFSKERAEGWVSPKDLKGLVSLKNLFGTPATARRVTASIGLSPGYPAFRAYKDYTFFDPLRAKRGFSERLPDQQTNDQGEAEFALNLGRFEKATYQLRFVAEGFEAAGGRGVVAESAIMVSPLEHLIGYKSDGDLRFIKKGAARGVELIALDPALKKVAVSGLKAQLIEQRYVSVLTQQPNGTYQYESVRKEIPLSAKDLAISANGLRYSLPTGEPGDFLLIVRGMDDAELNRIEFSIAGQSNLTRSLDKNAELQIKLNKRDYAPGEEIELQIKAPYTGAGLITIERDRVYNHHWFKTTTTASVQRIRVPEGLEGNGYVNVAFVRAMDSPEIFMSPLSYGVAPFSVSREKRTNVIDLQSPDLARPGEPYRIRYKSRHPGKIVVFAVDEGILQVARYRTPDPLGHFFKKRALEVSTAQILDLILPEFKLIQALSAPGGDEAARALGQNLNPFKRKRDKPVAYWSGIIDSDATPRELVYRVPDYFSGSLRVMAVVVSPEAIGVAEKKAIVRGHFVLSPNVPTFVAPGDEFEVSVGVANNIEASGKEPEIALELVTSPHLEALGAARQALKIGAGREGVASFKLRAKALLGSANLMFSASLGDKRTQYAVDLSVRPPLPYMTTVTSGHFKSDKVSLPVARKLYPQHRTLEVSASPLPLGLARGLTGYLKNYPYVCTEQLVSRAFPAIVLRQRPEFGYAPDKVEVTLEQALHILRARQNAEGAFGFWAANSHVSDMQTVYAVHFLTEAKERGYPIPNDLLAKGLGYLKALAANEGDTLSQARVRAYAIYILTRNGVVTTNHVNSLRGYLEDKHAKQWKNDLIGVYLAATYKLLKNDSAAESLIGAARLGEAQVADYAYFYDGLVRDAQLLYVFARHFPERLKSLSGDDILALVKPVTLGQYNTISSAYLILALDAYAAAVTTGEVGALVMHEVLAGAKTRLLTLPKGLFPKVEFSDQAEAITIASDSKYHTFYQLTQAGFDLAPPAREIKQRLEVQREYRDLKGVVTALAPLGGEIEVHVKVRSVEQGGLQNVAIVDLLPGGFEVVLDAAPRERVTGDSEERVHDQRKPGGGRDWASPIASAQSSWRPEYVDIREDRVVIFGAVGPSAQEFIYRIKATNRGSFAIPPVFGESMYDRSVQARGLGGKMVVEGQ